MNTKQISALTELATSAIKKSKYLTPTCEIKTAQGLGLNLTNLTTDSLKLSETGEFTKKLLARYKTSPFNMTINGKSGLFTKFEGSQMGSNPAFWCRNQENGALYYVKVAKDSAKNVQIESEVLATKLYNLAGIKTPEIELCQFADGKIGLASKFEEGMKEIDNYSKVQSSFATDAWLANWDSLIDGNTLLKDDFPIKIDCGGALRYRAQGALKPNFGDKVEELVSLTDGRNWASSSVYGKMEQQKLLESFKKVTNISDDSIRATVSDEELAQTLINRKNYLLQVQRKIEQVSCAEGKLSEYFAAIDKQLIQEKELFDLNWSSVMNAYEKANGSSMTYFGTVHATKAVKLTNPEKAIALYCDDDYSTAVNLFQRYGKNHESYEWYAQEYGLTEEVIPKFKETVKYALKTVPSVVTHQGTTYRWQMAGTFAERFKDVKVGETFVDSSFVSTSEKIFNCDSFRQTLNRERKLPEIIIIKGKNGKKIPDKCAGFRAYENEVLYNADTKYKYLGTKEITTPDEIGLAETIQFFKESNNPFADFKPCKAIYLEEV